MFCVRSCSINQDLPMFCVRSCSIYCENYVFGVRSCSPIPVFVFFHPWYRPAKGITGANSANSEQVRTSANSANSEQVRTSANRCEQRTVRTAKTIEQVRTVRTANKDFLKKCEQCEQVRTSANTVRGSLFQDSILFK